MTINNLHLLRIGNIREYDGAITPAPDGWAKQKTQRVPYSSEEFEADLKRLRESWRKYRKSRSRKAIYRLLVQVYDQITIWSKLGRTEQRCLRATSRVGVRCRRPLDPYAALLAVAAHPKTIDRRTLAKWSRVLRYAAEYKRPNRRLRAFIQANGGVNGAAALFTQRLGRKAKLINRK